MIAVILSAALATGGVTKLSKTSVGGLTLKAPKEWATTKSDETSIAWEELESGASLAVSSFQVDPRRAARVCLTELVNAVGKDGFRVTKLGGHPAAKKVSTDYLKPRDDGSENPPQRGEQVTTTTVLGCNGKTKWLLTWSAKTADGPRFGSLLKRVLDSISYAR